jgi:hypothetical protein
MSETFPVDHHDFSWNITEQFDDHDMLAWLNITSSSFGKIQYKYDLETQIPALYKDLSTHDMWYNKNNTSINLRIQGDRERLARLADKQHSLLVTINDDKDQRAFKFLRLNMTVFRDTPNAKIVEIDAPAPIKLLPYFAKIDRISVFGEIDIILNSSDHRTKEIDLEQFDNKTIEIYVKPENDWNSWYTEDKSDVNFTWVVKEFS